MRNRFPGHCLRCNKYVPVGEGHFQRHSGKWLVRCKLCTGKGNKPLPINVRQKKGLDKVD